MKQPFTDQQTVQAYPVKGMLRGPSGLVLPPNIAYLSQDADHRQGMVERRKGCYRVYNAPDPANGRLFFDGTNNRRVEFPDISAYDLGTKWAIIVQGRIPAAPGGTQYLFTRDVTPVSAGKKTFGLSISTTRRLGFEMNLSDGTSTPLAAAAASAVVDNAVFTGVVYRSGATLALHLDGNPTPAITRSDLSASLSNIAGAQKAIVGLNSNDNGVANFTGLFVGDIGWVAILQDFTSVADLLKWSTAGPYADSLDPRVVLLASFAYSDEGATEAKDRSYLHNDGTLLPVGLEPTRLAWLGIPVIPTQWMGTFGKPATGSLQNCAWVAGRFLASTVRPGEA
jgi:hypothetical protein